MEAWLAHAGERPAVLVTVAIVEGSGPREPGAKMLVDAQRLHGTIGGGHLELRAEEVARGMLANGQARRLERFALGPSLGQCCGGVVHLAFELVDAGQMEVLKGRADADTWRLVALDGAPDSVLFDDNPKITVIPAQAGTHRACEHPHGTQTAAAPSTVIPAQAGTHRPLEQSNDVPQAGALGMDPRLRGDDGLLRGVEREQPAAALSMDPGVRRDDGLKVPVLLEQAERELSMGPRLRGDDGQLLAIEPAQPDRDLSMDPGVCRDDGAEGGGGMIHYPVFARHRGTHVMQEQDGRRWLVDLVAAPRAHLVLFGAGHVGAAIVRALAELPCRVTWVDERDEMFPESIPSNVTVEATDTPESVVASAPIGASYLVMTHSHALDQRLSEAILSRPGVAWFGLIGSHTKRKQFEHRLRARGIDTDRIDAMVCPIGVPGITGKQPAVIAAAVAAQLLQVWEAQAAQAEASAPSMKLVASSERF
jgi:xanthine dehydrogenase accessory protein XdhC